MISLHALLEITGSIFLLLVVYNIYRANQGEIHSAMIVLIGGLLLAAVNDTFHAVEATKHHELIPIWVPWSWGVSRMILGGMLVVTASFAVCKPPRSFAYYTIAVGVILSLVLNSAPVIYPEMVESLNFVQHDGIIKRPIDTILFIGWAMMTMLMWRGGEARLVFPRGFRWFMSLGALSHLIMAVGSLEALDFWFMIAHVVKLGEYYVWAHFTHKDSQRSNQVGVEVYHAERVGENLQELDRISAALADTIESLNREKENVR